MEIKPEQNGGETKMTNANWFQRNIDYRKGALFAGLAGTAEFDFIGG